MVAIQGMVGSFAQFRAVHLYPGMATKTQSSRLLNLLDKEVGFRIRPVGMPCNIPARKGE